MIPTVWRFRGPVYEDAPQELADYGDAWSFTMSSVALRVPSALSPVEFNYLLNPEHSDFYGIVQMAQQIPLFRFDSRLKSDRKWSKGGEGAVMMPGAPVRCHIKKPASGGQRLHTAITGWFRQFLHKRCNPALLQCNYAGYWLYSSCSWTQSNDRLHSRYAHNGQFIRFLITAFFQHNKGSRLTGQQFETKTWGLCIP